MDKYAVVSDNDEKGRNKLAWVGLCVKTSPKNRIDHRLNQLDSPPQQQPQPLPAQIPYPEEGHLTGSEIPPDALYRFDHAAHKVEITKTRLSQGPFQSLPHQENKSPGCTEFRIGAGHQQIHGVCITHQIQPGMHLPGLFIPCKQNGSSIFFSGGFIQSASACL